MTRWLLALAAAVSFAWGWSHVVHALQGRIAPSGWRTTAPDLPVFGGTDHELGEGKAWTLANHAAFTTETPGALDVVVEIPHDGRVELTISAPAGDIALVLNRQGAERSGLVLRNPDSSWLACDEEVPRLADGPIAVSLRVDDQVRAAVDGQVITCANGLPHIKGRSIRGTVQRTRVLEIDGEPAAGMPWALFLGLAGALCGGVAVVGWLVRRRYPWVAWALAPIVLSGPFAYLDGELLRESLRIPAAHPLAALVLLPVLLSAALLLGGVVVELTRAGRARVAGALAALCGLGLGVVAAPSVTSPSGLAGLGLGLAFGLAVFSLVFVNVRRPRGFNLLSLVCMAAIGGTLEGLLRHSALAATWSGVSKADRAQIQVEHAALQGERQYSEYPASGYPIEPPERTEPLRIVAFGGSSTGGAFTNDDLDTFYPAALERRLDGVQVVNQGVGGWTTLHIRRYVESGLERVDPDIAILYVGHNDRMTAADKPYADVFSELDRGPATAVALALAELRTYQGFRFFVRTLAGGVQGMAVPPEHTRDNVQAIVAALDARGTRTLLAREGVSSGAPLLLDYERVLKALAVDGVAYGDAASVLEDPAASGYFVDNVHLSSTGHDVLAAFLHNRLLELGWLEH
ncbi:MAG: SGNH/GDSL hydrolase family protein [Proteobacteria bacterium]|nr:SGNH/GDSL hydrolase family protein [Pseudomonadota bacterium]MCP4919313.1 SGNH/GDSL hydrolase family protein [Pseudomonadota bacterium]